MNGAVLKLQFLEVQKNENVQILITYFLMLHLCELGRRDLSYVLVFIIIQDWYLGICHK